MKKKWLLLLIGVSVLVASGCSKKEAVTAEELLGNPYGAVVESGDFDIEVNLTASGKEYALKGNVQFDKSGVHFKGSQTGENLDSVREYYVFRSGNDVKRYDYTADTGRWAVTSDSTLDTSGYLALPKISSFSLEDFVVFGSTTVGNLGSFGVCPVCWVENRGIDLDESVVLKTMFTFDKDSKSLRDMSYTLSEAQPGGLTGYAFTVTVNSINNISVSVPKDVTANAIDTDTGSSGNSSGISELYTVDNSKKAEAERSGLSIIVTDLPENLPEGYEHFPYDDELVAVMQDLDIDVFEEDGLYYASPDDITKANIELIKRNGGTVYETLAEGETLVEEVEEPSASGDQDKPDSSPEKQTEAESSGTTPETSPAATGNKEQFGSISDYDTALAALIDIYPDLSKEYSMGGEACGAFIYVIDKLTMGVTISGVPWDALALDQKQGIAMCVDLGIMSMDEACASFGTDSGTINSVISSLR